MTAALHSGRRDVLVFTTLLGLLLLSSARPAPRAYEAAFEPQPYLHPLYVSAILEINAETQIPLDVLSRMIDRESRWDAACVSGPNSNGSMDIGLMQLNTRYLSYFVRYNDGQKIDPHNPEENLKVGMRYLSDLYRRMGSWYDAVAAYNAGPTSVVSGKIPATTKAYLEFIFGGDDGNSAP